MQQMVQCPRCGAQNYPNQPICWNCGLQLFNYQQQPPQQPPPQQMPPYQQQQYQQQQYQSPYQQQQYGYGWQQQPKKGPSLLLILLAVCVVLLIGAGSYLMISGGEFHLPFGSGSSDTQPTGDSDEEQTTDSEPEEEQVKTELSITELTDEYTTDPEAAASKYKGKIVTITGVLESASYQEGTVLVTDGETATIGAQCQLLTNELAKIYELEPEQTIKVRGKVDDYDIYINIIDCSIIS
jgi:hypothetical protein